MLRRTFLTSVSAAALTGAGASLFPTSARAEGVSATVPQIPWGEPDLVNPGRGQYSWQHSHVGVRGPDRTAVVDRRNVRETSSMTQPVRRPPVVVDPGLARALSRLLVVTAALTVVHVVPCAGLAALAWSSSIGDRQDATLVQRFYLSGSLVDMIRLLLIVTTAVLWCVWQAGLARAAWRLRPGHLRRTPLMHVLAWFIPVVGLWFPQQDVRDLERAFPGRGGEDALPVGSWWAAWIVAAVVLGVRPATGLEVTLALGMGALVGVEPDIMVVSALDVVADVALVLAAVHARRIVLALTRRAHAYAASAP